MSLGIPGAHSKHRLLDDKESTSFTALDDQGGENLRLTFAETSDGNLWPWGRCRRAVPHGRRRSMAAPRALSHDG